MKSIERFIYNKGKTTLLSISGLTIISAILYVSFGILIKYTVDNPEKFNSLHWLIIFSSTFLIIRVAMPLCYALIEYLIHNKIIDIEKELREIYLDRIEKSKLENFQDKSKGDVISVFNTAMSSIGSYIRIIWSDALPVLLQTTFVVISVSLYLGWSIAFQFTLLVLVYCFTVIKLTNMRIPLMKDVSLSIKKMNGILHDIINNFLIDKVFDTEKKAITRYTKVIELYNSKQNIVRKEFFRFGVHTTLISFIGSLLIISYACYKFRNGFVTLGSLVMLTTFLFQVFLPINRIGMLWRQLHRAKVDFNILSELILQMKSTKSKIPLTFSLENNICIEFNNATKERGNKTIFKNLNKSLIIEKDNVTLLTGDNGAGKSTIAKLIAGIESLDDGELLINGHNVSSATLQSKINGITYLPQHPSLLNMSIIDNFHYFSDGADLNEFCDLLSRLNLSKPLDFIVGDSGGNLSGGELQKINIVLCIINKPSFIIMDEPTNGLDKESTSLLYELIDSLRFEMKILLISHNVSFLSLFTDPVEYKI